VSGHFAQAGFSVVDGANLKDLVQRACNTGRRDVGDGYWLARAADRESGAGLDVVGRGNQVECAKPTFTGAAGAIVRVLGVHPDDECAWCAGVVLEVLDDFDADDEAYPAVAEVTAYAALRDRLVPGVECRASLAVFAEALSGYGEAEQGWLAPRSAIPTGLFGTGPRPVMLLTGHVEAAERRRNALTGGEVCWARVESYAATYDVLVPPGAPLPEVGQVVKTDGWLLATLDLPGRE
jgi:hypothetical protein